jgi:hypothetical protein
MAFTLGKNYAKIYDQSHPRSQKVFDRGGGPNGSGSGGVNYFVAPMTANTKITDKVPVARFGPDLAGAVRRSVQAKKLGTRTFGVYEE